MFEWIAIFLLIWFLTIVLNIPDWIHRFNSRIFNCLVCWYCQYDSGGIGSFDLVFLWGTQSLGLLDEKVLVLLILYRMGYFVFPFLFAVILFIKEYWEKWNHSWDNVPNMIYQKISHSILTFLIFVSGIILLLSASVPGILSRLKIAQDFLSLPIMNVSHQLTVAAGFILLGLCRGIEYKVKRTYRLAIIVLSSAALFSIFKGFDYEEAIFLLIVAVLLISSKRLFYRESYVLTWGKVVFDLTVVFLLLRLYVFIGYLNLPSSKMQIPVNLREYVITDYRDLFYSAIIGVLIAFFILFIGYLIRRPKNDGNAKIYSTKKKG